MDREKISLFHYLFDQLYPAIRFYHEKVKGHSWFSEITPELILGGAPTQRRDYHWLKDHGVTGVIDIRAERKDDEAWYNEQGIAYLHLAVWDMGVPSSADFDHAVAFTQNQITQRGKVCIHCAKGRGRSAALMAAYLMTAQRINYEEAVMLMKTRRPLVKQEERHRQAVEAWWQAKQEQL